MTAECTSRHASPRWRPPGPSKTREPKSACRPAKPNLDATRRRGETGPALAALSLQRRDVNGRSLRAQACSHNGGGGQSVGWSFDSVSWEWLIRFLEHRIADRRLVRLIGKWLKAGVLEDGRLLEVERGTPQGAVISPVLANIYLHYVYDLWVHQWRRRQANGDVIVVRYADDTVVGFQHRSDAERFLEEFRRRLQRFGLKLHPQKTRIIEFGRFAERNRKARNLGKPETFAFLGFTHICGSNKGGGFFILRHTVRERLREKLRQVKETIKRMMHRPIAEQGLYLKRVMNGFLNYFAVPTNSKAINSFYRHVGWYWRRALRRRGQISRLTWQRMKRLTDLWLPPARIRHPLPDMRFDVMTQGRSPVR